MIDEAYLPLNTVDINTNYTFLHAACFMKNVSLVEKMLLKLSSGDKRRFINEPTKD